MVSVVEFTLVCVCEVCVCAPDMVVVHARASKDLFFSDDLRQRLRRDPAVAGVINQGFIYG